MNTYTTKDAALELGITPTRVRALISAGRLIAKKLGRDWLISAHQLSKIRVRKPGRPKKLAP